MTSTSSAAAAPAQRPPMQRRGIRFGELDWTVVIGIAAIHVGAIAAPWFFSWSALAAMVVLAWFCGGIGITLCYHRLLCHRSFRTPKWFQYVLTLIGCTNWQGGPVTWVGVHRIHHKHSDDELDPHSPVRHGFGWAHLFWCMHKHPEGLNAADAAKDLQRDTGMRLINRFFVVPQFALVVALYLVGEYAVGGLGWSWVLWGVCVRAVVVYHGTWFVNSATHTWGYRNYDTDDGSTNLWWVALLSFGEGWHNNHHAFQRSAAHGLRWFEFDITYWTIRALGLVGLARDIVLPSPEQLPKATSQAESTHANAEPNEEPPTEAAGGSVSA